MRIHHSLAYMNDDQVAQLSGLLRECVLLRQRHEDVRQAVEEKEDAVSKERDTARYVFETKLTHADWDDFRQTGTDVAKAERSYAYAKVAKVRSGYEYLDAMTHVQSKLATFLEAMDNAYGHPSFKNSLPWSERARRKINGKAEYFDNYYAALKQFAETDLSSVSEALEALDREGDQGVNRTFRLHSTYANMLGNVADAPSTNEVPTDALANNLKATEELISDEELEMRNRLYHHNWDIVQLEKSLDPFLSLFAAILHSHEQGKGRY